MTHGPGQTRALFVTWDGPQVQYLENLFLPVLARLADHGFAFDVMQFRWGPAEGTERARAACERRGIGYHDRRIGRWGGSAGAMLTALAGARHLRRTARTLGSEIIVVRSIMPALMALRVRSLPCRVVFDADGLPIDERAEFGGLSTIGATYRMMREIEAQMVRKAGATLSRTDAGAQILRARAGPGLPPGAMHVVANGSDPERFKPLSAEARSAFRTTLGVLPTTPLLIYVGSIGSQYRLGESLSLLRHLRSRQADAQLLILTGTPELARHEVGAAGFADERRIAIRSCAPGEVAQWIAAADFGTAYRQTGFSMAGVSPVKIGEYLLCGTPVVGTAAIGATPAAIDAGVFIDEAPGPAALAQILADLFSDPVAMAARRAAARRIGLADYSLAQFVQGYAAALQFALDDEQTDGP